MHKVETIWLCQISIRRSWFTFYIREQLFLSHKLTKTLLVKISGMNICVTITTYFCNYRVDAIFNENEDEKDQIRLNMTMGKLTRRVIVSGMNLNASTINKNTTWT